MSLADLISRTLPTTDKTADAIQRLTQELAEAREVNDRACRAWGNAVAEEEAGGGDAALTSKLDLALNKAIAAVRTKGAALQALQARQKASEAKARVDEQGERWARSERLATLRFEAAMKMGQATEAFARSYTSLAKLSAELAGSLPSGADLDAVHVFQRQVEASVRQDLLRHGMNWAFSAPFGVVSLPEFLPPFSDTPELVRRWRDTALGTGKG